MAIKKSDLYSSLWASCDQLRGSMDASQYKDYVLVILFMKYASDREDPLIKVPEGASYYDMVAVRGQSDIGDRINKIIGEFAKINGLTGIITVADFNDDEKLGKGKDKVDRLSNLISIFQRPELDFSDNGSDGDDLLGDAYEYLMRHFATQSGKSKGQFYTPSEVSRIMAKVVGIDQSTDQMETLYDPTAGSGSLLLKAADEAPYGVTIYGQENDNATRALAVMNMWLHGHADADIALGNTLADPEFTDPTTGELRTFDYAVANPPFSYKSWTNGLDAENDIYKRFEGYGIPPKKNGDYAFLLHLIKSLKSRGKACIILPHGVLFRGNVEGRIRENLVRRGYIKGIIGLPANLFYGTGIPACILVIDKEGASDRQGIFMMDASEGYMKDGNKNRLRERDIHKIVDLFRGGKEEKGYSRFVPIDEIAANDFNLNLPRYIDTSKPEDIQDIQAHIKGGIPVVDIDGLQPFWDVYPELREKLFKPLREGYVTLNVDKDAITETIVSHPEFTAYSSQLQQIFEQWKQEHEHRMRGIDEDTKPKRLIELIGDDLLERYRNKPLIDPYDIYQHLLDYWFEEMRDDTYMIVESGWEAKLEPVMKNGKVKKGEFECELVPKSLVSRRYFIDELSAIAELQEKLDAAAQEMEELEQEHASEEGLLAEAMSDTGNITKKNLDDRLKEIVFDDEAEEERQVLQQYKKAQDSEALLKKKVKEAEGKLVDKVIHKYGELTEEDVKVLVIDDKWLPALKERIEGEIEGISRALARRVNELGTRYDLALVDIEAEVEGLSSRVEKHLENMKAVQR